MVPSGSLVATTSLQLRTDEASLVAFQEVGGRVVESLFGSDGLLAAAIVTSDQCAVARTVTVWDSEEAMLAFVGSASHAEAIGRVGEMSRGGSVTTTFVTSPSSDLSWEEVAQRFEGHTGPVY
jgi:heme-degrading monooxygenase HmoA